MKTDVDQLLAEAKLAEWHIREGRKEIAVYERARKDAINALIDAGWSMRKLGAELGLSAARVNQIRNDTRTMAPMNGSNP